MRVSSVTACDSLHVDGVSNVKLSRASINDDS